ncbi:MAG: helix-turn-helix domain-containing protein [Salinivirgaceae bacterium]|nr:helix-turn-helix domain-containing protein [Salinivirgaceae bacterium]
MESEMLTIRQAAAFLGLSLHTMRKYATERRFPMYRSGGGKLLFVEKSELVKWLQAQRIERAARFERV